MSNSSLVASKKWDVFLSFRGEDTRTTFTGYLYSALVRNKIRTFRDDKLKRGREIESELFKAIEESIMVVIIFSTNFAKSTWCLRELAKVMDCQERSQLTVLPVFYKVNPSDVRAKRNDFSIAFDRPEHKDMIPEWRKALEKAGRISGRTLEAKRDEASFTDLVLEDIAGILETFNTTMTNATPSMPKAPGIKASASTNATHHVRQGNGKGVEAQKAAGKSKSRNKFDVFLSYGGMDSKFADKVLAVLVREGVSTFMSYKCDRQMEREMKGIGSEVLKAMEESRMAVIIFSKQHASSRWCLDVLVKIMSCLRDSKLMVLPIFYDVYDADVREQKSSYELTEHKKYYTEGQMRGWRTALTEAASLQGLILDRDVSSFMELVVQDITNKLGKPCATKKFDSRDVYQYVFAFPNMPKAPGIKSSASTNATHHVRQGNGKGVEAQKANSTEVKYTTAFSEEYPTVCDLGVEAQKANSTEVKSVLINEDPCVVM